MTLSIRSIAEGDRVKCICGNAWVFEKHRSLLQDFSGFEGLLVKTDGEDHFFLTNEGNLLCMVDNHSFPTKWEYLEAD